MTKKIVLAASLALIALLALASAAGARNTAAPYYIDELKTSNTLEQRGVYYAGRTRAIDGAVCLGLRRYGVRTSEFGLDRFWRFKCDLSGAENHWYTAQVSTTSGSQRGYWYWHILSVTRDF